MRKFGGEDARADLGASQLEWLIFLFALHRPFSRGGHSVCVNQWTDKGRRDRSSPHFFETPWVWQKPKRFLFFCGFLAWQKTALLNCYRLFFADLVASVVLMLPGYGKTAVISSFPDWPRLSPGSATSCFLTGRKEVITYLVESSWGLNKKIREKHQSLVFGRSSRIGNLLIHLQGVPPRDQRPASREQRHVREWRVLLVPGCWHVLSSARQRG